MASIRLKHVNSFYDRHGKLRHLARVPGQKAKTLPGLPGSEEFMAAYQAALAQRPGVQIGADQTKAGTFNALIATYYQSDAFTKALAPVTQSKRRNIIELFRNLFGGCQVRNLRRDHVVRLLQGRPPFAQRNWMKTMRGLMLFAIDQNYRADDPTAGVRPIKVGKSHGHMTWGDEQISQYRATHSIGTVARLAIELMLNFAARRGDVYQLGPQHIRGNKLCFRPNKTKRSTGKMLTIPIIPECQAAIDAMWRGGALTFLVNDWGRPFASAEAFGNKFAEWCREAGLERVECDDGKVRSYRAHGLRKASCIAMLHAGCLPAEIMAITGHSSLSQLQIYIAEYDRERMAQSAVEKLMAAKR
jgi:integrase